MKPLIKTPHFTELNYSPVVPVLSKSKNNVLKYRNES